MPREPHKSDAAPRRAASPAPTKSATPKSSQAKPVPAQSPAVEQPAVAEQPAAGNEQPTTAVPLRELIDAALHADGGPAAGSGSAAASAVDGDADGSGEAAVPLSRAERRNKKRGATPTTDRNYPSQSSTGRNGFARNPRSSPNRRQG
jgi:hypothetical protein